MNWFTRLVLCYICLAQGGANAHKVTSLLSYAENICMRLQAPSILLNDNETDTSNLVWEQKKCKYEYLGIITLDGNLVDLDLMSFTLGYIFGESSYSSGADLAGQIHEKCAEILSSVKEKPVSEWKPFFKCVSGIIRIERGVLTRGGLPQEEVDRLLNIQLSEEEIQRIHPKLCCHPKYNTETKDHNNGAGKLIYLYKFCKYGQHQDPDCVEKCMAEMMGLVEIYEKSFKYAVWNNQRSMIDRLRPFFVDSDYFVAKKIAENIISNCRDKVLKTPTHRSRCITVSWRDFFECVDPHLDCDAQPKDW